jgi:hypothetical protein
MCDFFVHHGINIELFYMYWKEARKRQRMLANESLTDAEAERLIKELTEREQYVDGVVNLIKSKIQYSADGRRFIKNCNRDDMHVLNHLFMDCQEDILLRYSQDEKRAYVEPRS